jgi:hypothetical protein
MSAISLHLCVFTYYNHFNWILIKKHKKWIFQTHAANTIYYKVYGKKKMLTVGLHSTTYYFVSFDKTHILKPGFQ